MISTWETKKAKKVINKLDLWGSVAECRNDAREWLEERRVRVVRVWGIDYKYEAQEVDEKDPECSHIVIKANDYDVCLINTILKMIESKGGKQWFFDLYTKRNSRIREGLQKFGLSMFPRSGYESPTVNCVNAPIGINGVTIYEQMRQKGFEIAKGYGSIQNTDP